MNAEERKVIAALYWELKDGNVSDFLSSGIGELTARGNTDLIADAQVQLRRHRDKLMALLDDANEVQIDLSPDACALIECAVRGARAEAIDDLATCRRMESPERQIEKDSETYAVGQRIATADNLIDVLDLAVCISVTLPSGTPATTRIKAVKP